MEILNLSHQVYHGNSARMDLLGDGEADLVLTSPPYFSAETEVELSAPRSRQDSIHRVQNDIFSYASHLRPAFSEISRVLKPGRAFVVQTKDIRYGEFMIPLSDQHLSIAMSCGFNLVGRFNWVPRLSHIRRRPVFISQKRVGQFRVASGETFLILAKSPGLYARGKIEDIPNSLDEMSLPLWRMPFRRRQDDHRHVSPRPVIASLINFFTERGDLVVDPFSGFGTILAVAKSLDRSGIGWDIDADCVAEANKRLQ